VIDEPAGGVKYDFHQRIAGDFNFHERAGFVGGRGYALDYLGRHEPLSAMPQFFAGFVPKAMLQAIAAQSDCEDRPGEGDRSVVHVVSFAGSPRNLVMDGSGRLIEVRRPPQPTLYGPLNRKTFYSEYRRVGGVWVPGEIQLRASNPVHGTYVSRLRLQRAGTAKLSDRDARPPAKSSAAPARDTEFKVIPKGGGAYLLRNVAVVGRFSYNVLLVGQRDRVLIFDAVADEATSDKVRAEAQRLFPGKPLTLILSHPHGDHVAGIRPYLKSGTPIVAPVGLAALIERLKQPGDGPSPVEEVAGSFTIRDPDNPVGLLDFQSAHAERLLVAHLPRQRLLLQADLINQGDYPANAHSRALLRWIKARRLDVGEIAGVHGESVRPDEPLL
jgi:hypothetical protein